MSTPGPEDEAGLRLAESLAKGENEDVRRLVESGAVLDLESLLRRDEDFQAGRLNLRERMDYTMSVYGGVLVMLGLDPWNFGEGADRTAAIAAARAAVRPTGDALTQFLVDMLGDASGRPATRALAAIALGVLHADRGLLEEKAVLDRPLFQYTRVRGQLVTRTRLSLGQFWCLGRDARPAGKSDLRVVEALRQALSKTPGDLNLDPRWMGGHQLDLDLGMLLSAPQARTWGNRRYPWEPKIPVLFWTYPLTTVAAVALILIGDRESAGRVLAAAVGFDGGTAANVVEFAYYLGWDSVLSEIVEGVRAPCPDGGGRPIGLLGRFKEGAEPLGALLADSEGNSWRGRREAIGALAAIGGPAVVGYLAAALDDERVEIREAAAWALGESGDASALPHLTAALKDKKKAMRKAAAAAIAKLGH